MYPYHEHEELKIPPLPEDKRTKSLSQILAAQPNVIAEHEKEKCTWYFKSINLINNLARLYGLLHFSEDHYLAVATAYYFLPYIKEFFKVVNGIKVVCLRRDKEGTVTSFMRKAAAHGPGRNWFTCPRSKIWKERNYIWPSRAHNYFPSFNLPMEEAIAAYHDMYYEMAEELVHLYPSQFRIYEFLDVLTNHLIQREALLFLGVKPETMIIDTTIRENQLEGVVEPNVG
jgi:hypothetical protein